MLDDIRAEIKRLAALEAEVAVLRQAVADLAKQRDELADMLDRLVAKWPRETIGEEK